MKIPKIPGLPWWAEVGLQVAVLAGMAIAAEVIERKRKELFNASGKETNDKDDAVEGEWWSS